MIDQINNQRCPSCLLPLIKTIKRTGICNSCGSRAYISKEGKLVSEENHWKEVYNEIIENYKNKILSSISWGKEIGIDVYVYIIGHENSCSECKKYDRSVYLSMDFLKNPVIPNINCAHKNRFSCATISAVSKDFLLKNGITWNIY